VRIHPPLAAVFAHPLVVAVLQLLRLDRQHLGQGAQVGLTRHGAAVQPAGDRLLGHGLAAEPRQQPDQFGRTFAHASLAQGRAEAVAKSILFRFHAPTLGRRRTRFENRCCCR